MTPSFDSSSEFEQASPAHDADIVFPLNKPTSEERTWAILAHLSAVIAMVVSAGWLNFVGPLIIWALKKDSSQYVRHASAQSFNFNLGMWIMSVAGWILVITIILLPTGLIVLAISFLLTLWHHIRASIAASRDEFYTYPWQIKILN